MAVLNTVAAEARRLDPDRFLGALFAADPVRDDLWALIAFDGIVAEVPLSVREAGLGLIRLQWWRDAIARAAGCGAQSPAPVMAALGAAIVRHHLSPDAFEPLLAARERELEDKPPADLAELGQHADTLAGAFAGLALRVVGAESSAAREAAIRVAGAHALVRLAFMVPARAAAGRPLLVAAERAAHDAAGVNVAIERLVARARGLLAEARALRSAVERTALPLLLPAGLLDARLNALAAAEFDPYRVPARPSATRGLRLAWAALRSRY